MSSLAGMKNVTLGSAAFAYVQTPAQKSLATVVAARGTTLSINSGLRTLPQQYLLYRWYQNGTCGIGLAASPGNSNHESGLAVDIDDNAGWRPFFESRGWKWLGAGDPVHFDYVAGGKDIKNASVLAFQKLWNANHPTDLLAEDGAYGPDTEARIAKSPIGGFPKALSCPPASADAGVRDASTPRDGAPLPADLDGSTLGDAGPLAELGATGECGCAIVGSSGAGAGSLLAGLALIGALMRRSRAGQRSSGRATE